jgi:hypothetical protein
VRCRRSVRFSVRDHRLPGRLEAVWGWEGEMGMGFGVLDSVIIGFVGLPAGGECKTARRKVTPDSSQRDRSTGCHWNTGKYVKANINVPESFFPMTQQNRDLLSLIWISALHIDPSFTKFPQPAYSRFIYRFL